MRGGAVAEVGSRRPYGLVEYERVVAVVGLRLRRIGLLMGSERCVYGPVVAWLVCRGCSAKFGVARSRFVLLTQHSVTTFFHRRLCYTQHAFPLLSG